MNARALRTTALASLLVMALALPACSGGSNDSPTDPGNPNAVSVVDNSFDPSSTMVDGGETVTWAWQGSNQHNVTWTTANLPNSPTQASGSHQVTMPSDDGTYNYYCTIHGSPNSGMRGSITVE